MRRTFFAVITFLVFSTAATAQRLDSTGQITPARQDYNRYLKQRNTFNKLGWIMLGAGAVMCGTSYLAYARNGFNGTWDLEPLFIAGLVSGGTSLPLFVAASVNKRKARLALKGENFFLRTQGFGARYPAIVLQLSL